MECKRYKVLEAGKPYVSWEYCKERAFVWDADRRVQPNFYAAASNLEGWLSNQEDLRNLSDAYRREAFVLTNPFSYSLSAITIVLTEVNHDCSDFMQGLLTTEADLMEVQRIRLINELALYCCRFYEAYAKQLLYLTSFARKDYRQTSLGGLIEQKCVDCGNQHKVTVLGSLAYSFGLEDTFKTTVFEAMKIIKSHRDQETAHAESGALNPYCGRETLERFTQSYQAIATAFRKTLDPLGALEAELHFELVSECIGGRLCRVSTSTN